MRARRPANGRLLLGIGGVLACAVVAFALAACGSSDDETASPPASTAESTAAATTGAPAQTAGATSEGEAPTETAAAGADVALPEVGNECGDIPEAPAPADPDGALAALPPEVQLKYAGYPGTVYASPWADWKPDHGPPYKIAWLAPTLQNDYGVAMTDQLEQAFAQAKEQGLVEGELITNSADFDATTQVQQMNSLIQQGVDIILVTPVSGDALAPVVDAAAAAGIPVISQQGDIPTKNAVSIQQNPVNQGATEAAYIAGLLEGTGNVLLVDGIPTLPIDQQVRDGATSAFALCPDIEILATIEGGFTIADAKTATLQFLSTNPTEVDAVWQAAVMAPGVIDAFEQAGREVPPVTMSGGDKAAFAWWRDHVDEGYSTIGTTVGNRLPADVTWNIAMRMLAGQGVKVSFITDTINFITNENLDQVAEADWTVDTPGAAEPPPCSWLLGSTLDDFFNDPGPAPGEVGDCP